MTKTELKKIEKALKYVERNEVVVRMSFSLHERGLMSLYAHITPFPVIKKTPRPFSRILERATAHPKTEASFQLEPALICKSLLQLT